MESHYEPAKMSQIGQNDHAEWDTAMWWNVWPPPQLHKLRPPQIKLVNEENNIQSYQMRKKNSGLHV